MTPRLGNLVNRMLKKGGDAGRGLNVSARFALTETL